MNSTEDRGRSSYLDLLISVLNQHEKALDSIVERMEKLAEELAKAKKELDLAKGESHPETMATREISDTVVYMKVRINRSIDEVVKILEVLKE